MYNLYIVCLPFTVYCIIVMDMLTLSIASIGVQSLFHDYYAIFPISVSRILCVKHVKCVTGSL